MEHRRPQIDHELLLAQSGWVRGLARNLVQDPLGAEDVVQDTMLAALAAPPARAHDERSLRAWLSRVVTNLAHLTSRRSARRRRREEQVARPDRVGSAAEAVEHAGQLQRVVEAVLKLDEPYRSTVLLRYFDGLSTERIAARTGAAPATVRKRLSRGVERLRRGLDEDSGGDRREWIAAMLPFVRRGFPRLPAPESSVGPWLAGLRVAAIALGLLTVAGLSALVAVSLRAQPDARPAVPAAVGSAGERELAASEPEPVPLRDTVLWDLPYERAERAEPTRVQPGIEPEPEPAAPPPPMAETRQRVAGRVVDLEGYGLAGLELVVQGASDGAPGAPVAPVAPGTVLAHTGRGGGFEFLSAEGDFVLAARGAGYATLRASRVGTGPSRREHLLVAERSLDLLGRVLGEEGQPLEGAELSLVVPDEAYLALPLALDRSQLIERSARSDAQGAFELAGVVAHPALLVRTRLEGYVDDLRPVLSGAGGTWTVRLERPAGPAQRLEGLVFLPDGRPAAEAVVRLGPETTRTDPRGRFSLPFDPTLAGTLVAHTEGLPPTVETLVPDGPGGARPPPFKRLHLGGELLEISGTLSGAGGEPLSGWVVLAGDERGDPRYPELPPGAPVRRTTTDPRGAFELGGLLTRDYTLRAYDPASLASPVPTQVAAGRCDVRLCAAGWLAEPEQGAVVDRRGLALPFARVERRLDTGGGTHVLGASTLADEYGRFQLPGRTGRPAAIVLQHKLVLAAQFGGAGVVEVPLDAWFVYTGGSWPSAPDSVQVRDRTGGALLLHGPSGSARSMPLHGGRTNVLRVSEDARTLIFYRRGEVLGRLPLNLVPGELVFVGGRGPGMGLGVATGPAGALPPGGAAKNSGNPVTPGAARQP